MAKGTELAITDNNGAKLQQKIDILQKDTRALREVVADLTGLDVRNGKDAQEAVQQLSKRAPVVRMGKAASRGAGATLAGVLWGIGGPGKAVAALLAFGGAIMDMFGVSEGAGMGARAADVAGGSTGGVLGAKGAELGAKLSGRNRQTTAETL